MKQDTLDELYDEYIKDTGFTLSDTDDGGKYRYVTWLEKELIASRESRQLSAVPSEDEIEKWYIEKYGVARDLNGKPSWNSQSIGYRTDGDLFEMLNDFVEWIKQRGVAG